MAQCAVAVEEPLLASTKSKQRHRRKSRNKTGGCRDPLLLATRVLAQHHLGPWLAARVPAHHRLGPRHRPLVSPPLTKSTSTHVPCPGTNVDASGFHVIERQSSMLSESHAMPIQAPLSSPPLHVCGTWPRHHHRRSMTTIPAMGMRPVLPTGRSQTLCWGPVGARRS